MGYVVRIRVTMGLAVSDIMNAVSIATCVDLSALKNAGYEDDMEVATS